jgi:hypothetical protein
MKMVVALKNLIDIYDLSFSIRNFLMTLSGMIQHIASNCDVIQKLYGFEKSLSWQSVYQDASPSLRNT